MNLLELSPTRLIILEFRPADEPPSAASEFLQSLGMSPGNIIAVNILTMAIALQMQAAGVKPETIGAAGGMSEAVFVIVVATAAVPDAILALGELLAKLHLHGSASIHYWDAGALKFQTVCRAECTRPTEAFSIPAFQLRYTRLVAERNAITERLIALGNPPTDSGNAS